MAGSLSCFRESEDVHLLVMTLLKPSLIVHKLVKEWQNFFFCSELLNLSVLSQTQCSSYLSSFNLKCVGPRMLCILNYGPCFVLQTCGFVMHFNYLRKIKINLYIIFVLVSFSFFQFLQKKV